EADMLGVKIAVNIANPSLYRATNQKIPMISHKLSADTLARFQRLAVDQTLEKRLDIGQVLVPSIFHDREVNSGFNGVSPLGSCVEFSKMLSQVPHHIRRDLLGFQDQLQHPLFPL